MESAKPTVFLDDADYDILCAAAQKQFLTLVRKYISAKSVVIVNAFDDTLVIESCVGDVDAISNNALAIAELAYIKLGCNSVELFCTGEFIESFSKSDFADYNEHHQDTTETAMIATTSRPAPAQQSTTKWVSFENLSLAMGVPSQELENLARTSGIPQKEQDGRWGLSVSQAQGFARVYADYKVMSAFGGDEAAISDDDFAESVRAISAVESVGIEQNGSGTAAELEPMAEEGEGEGDGLKTMRFPRDYKPAPEKNGKRSNPNRYADSLDAALTKAGKEAPTYLQRIIDGTASESFMQKLLKTYPTDPKQQEKFVEAARRKLEASS